jgi:serine/threonine-protein kinase
MVAFHEMLECAPELREAKLTELDLSEKAQVRLRAMLAANSRVPDWQSDIAHSWKSCRDADVLAQSLVGTSIGGFRLLALIGQGGSSAVFRAERDAGDASQIVALKVLRTGLYSEDAQRRFRREQESSRRFPMKISQA